MTYGIYGSTFSDEDKAFLDNSKLGEIEGEIRLMRVRLFRLAKLAEEVESGKMSIDKAPVVESIEENSSGTGGGENPGTWDKTSIKSARRLPDYYTLIDRYAARVALLEKTRAELLGTIPGEKDIIEVEGGLPIDEN